MSTIFAELPQTTRAKAEQAFAEAFPAADLQSLVPLHGGLSGALVYKLLVNERPVVLRIIDGRDPFNNPGRQFTCMQLAAKNSVAPQVHYTSVELGVSITDYVEHQPAMALLQRDAHQIAECGALLRRLHHGPAFPVFPDIFEMIAEGRERLARSGVILPNLLDELLTAFETVRLALQPHLTLAPCHNDLNPGNVLYDGTRLWLVDWEGASMGDPIFDLASLIHWFLLDPRQEAALLRAYFQRDPEPFELAKLELMKQVSWCFHATVFFLFSLNDDGTYPSIATPREQLPNFAQALRALGTGELPLQEANTRQLLSLVIAKQSLDEMSQPMFGEALTCLATA